MNLLLSLNAETLGVTATMATCFMLLSILWHLSDVKIAINMGAVAGLTVALATFGIGEQTLQHSLLFAGLASILTFWAWLKAFPVQKRAHNL